MKKILYSLILFSILVNIKAEECKNRGDLDILYCDENYDLVADLPKNSKDLKNPDTLVFAINPFEDVDLIESIYQPFTNHLANCTKKKVIFFKVQNSSAEIEAMRSGRLHIGGMGAGAVPFAVNTAGAIPFALKGFDDGSLYVIKLMMIVKKNSPYQKLEDLKGKIVAHTHNSSNVGHMAPMVLLPKNGLIPGQDYKIAFSGKYDQSVMGVKNGDYDAAIVGDNTFEHMMKTTDLNYDDFRIIYKSKEEFPTIAYSYAHNLEPKLVDKIKECFFNFEYTAEMKEIEGADKFQSINYKDTWAVIRDISEKNGVSFAKP